jgi:hypothetical protein
MVQNLASRLTAGQQVASVGVGKAARWAVLPFRVWGVVVGTGGAGLLAIVAVIEVASRVS